MCTSFLPVCQQSGTFLNGNVRSLPKLLIPHGRWASAFGNALSESDLSGEILPEQGGDFLLLELIVFGGVDAVGFQLVYILVIHCYLVLLSMLKV